MGWRNRIRKDRVNEGLEIAISKVAERHRLIYELEHAIVKLGPTEVTAIVAETVPNCVEVS